MAVELNKEQILGIVSLTMILTGAIAISLPEDTYYCPSRDMVLECFKLSSTGKSCYFGTTRKVCTEGWKPIIDYLGSNPSSAGNVGVSANNKQWQCSIINDEINSYTKCYSGVYEAYLGELI